jgi:phage shock protein A
MTTTPNFETRTKTFWEKPEGKVGTFFLIAALGGLGFLAFQNIEYLVGLAQNVLSLTLLIVAIATILFVFINPKTRNLLWYMYKSIMRSITGLFVKIDPIGILKSFVEDLESNLAKLSRQINTIRGQMRKLKNLVSDNGKEIEQNLKLASVAHKQNNETQVTLATRKAARLKEANAKYENLLNRLEVMNRILDKMYKNSEILIEDTKDQVKVKEQERKAIRTSHSAMKSAMAIISGDPDKRAMFDAALEHIADDLSSKVGEMERFMEMSANVMDSVDLENGMFEEEGMKMLEEWEKKSNILSLGDGTSTSSLELKDLKEPKAEPQTKSSDSDSYNSLFE